MHKECATVKDLDNEARRLVESLSPQKESALLVTLSGPLGAGKTTFTQAAARALGVTLPVTSPTFVLMKTYSLPSPQKFSRLVHIDAYRLASAAELASVGFSAIVHDPENLIFLEWPENVAEALPPPHVAISLQIVPTGARTLSYSYA